MSGHQAVGIQTCHDAWLPNTRRLELRGGYYTTVLKTVSTCQAFEVVSDLAMKRPKCHVNATLSQIARSDGPENPCRSPAERCKSSSVETWGRGPDNSRDLRIGDVVCYNLRELREVPRIPLLGPAALLASLPRNRICRMAPKGSCRAFWEMRRYEEAGMLLAKMPEPALQRCLYSSGNAADNNKLCNIPWETWQHQAEAASCPGCPARRWCS